LALPTTSPGARVIASARIACSITPTNTNSAKSNLPPGTTEADQRAPNTTENTKV